MQQGFVVGCFFLVTSILAPVLWHLWIYCRSANANFYFGVTLAFASAQVTLQINFVHYKYTYCIYFFEICKSVVFSSLDNFLNGRKQLNNSGQKKHLIHRCALIPVLDIPRDWFQQIRIKKCVTGEVWDDVGGSEDKYSWSGTLRDQWLVHKILVCS